MKNKKTMFTMMVGVIFALILSFLPQNEIRADPGGACSWGFVWVETSFWPWQNNITSKLCDCTEVSFRQYGDHMRCNPSTE